MIIGKSRCLPANTDMATMRHGKEEAIGEDQDADIRHGKIEDRLAEEAFWDDRREQAIRRRAPHSTAEDMV